MGLWELCIDVGPFPSETDAEIKEFSPKIIKQNI